MKPFAVVLRPLFCHVQEGEMSDAIVTYRKYQYGYRDIPLTLEVAAGGTDMQFRRPLYEHRLQVDLLFLVVAFRWKDK